MPGCGGLEGLVESWVMLRPGLNLPRGPWGVAVAPEGWGVAVVAPEQALWCCRVVPGLSPRTVCILLWLSRLSVCDRLQASGHGTSSVVGVTSVPTHAFQQRQGLLTGLFDARGSGQSQI